MKRIPGRECRLGVKVAVGQSDIHEQGQIRRYRRRERRQVEIGKEKLDQAAGKVKDAAEHVADKAKRALRGSKQPKR